MGKQKDYIAEIMQQWYDAMDKEKVGVQPKCATILGTIMAKYKITEGEPRDIWAEALTKRGGEFMDWYKSLSEAQQKEYHDKLTYAQDHKRDHVDKQLLKG
jgi:hypothetical protein